MCEIQWQFELKDEQHPLILSLRQTIMDLQVQCVLKDKQIRRQGEVIRAIQLALGSAPAPLN